jgi:hypothetical protein
MQTGWRMLGAAAVLATIAACGGTGTGTTSTSTVAPIDTCMAGTWHSTTLAVSLGGAKATITGGTGEAVTIAPGDDSITFDDSATTPFHATLGTVSAAGRVQGRASGTITPKGTGKFHVDISKSTWETVTLGSSGKPVGAAEPRPKTLDFSYTCSAGQMLVLTTTDGRNQTTTVSYKP